MLLFGVRELPLSGTSVLEVTTITVMLVWAIVAWLVDRQR